MRRSANQLDLDDLLDVLAERVAEKVSKRLAVSKGTELRARLLTIKQAGAYIGRSPKAVEHLVRSGKIRRVDVGGDRRVFIDRVELDQLIESNRS